MTIAVATPVDRSMRIAPGQVVKTGWVAIDCVVLGCRDRMAVGDVEHKWREILNRGGDGSWPPPRGHWDAARFVIVDGRHEYVAALMHGQTEIFVAWVE